MGKHHVGRQAGGTSISPARPDDFASGDEEPVRDGLPREIDKREYSDEGENGLKLFYLKFPKGSGPNTALLPDSFLPCEILQRAVRGKVSPVFPRSKRWRERLTGGPS